jgi:integral membrane protein (TIGR01906 family)
MRDVRGVFIGFFAIAAVAAASAVAIVLARRADGRLATWRAVRAGAVGLVAGLVIAGAVAVVAFDALFEAFHRLLFAGGSYTFDPGTDRLVQLFPFQFWQETAIAVGAVAIVAALIVAVIAQRRVATSPIHQSSPAGLEGSRP